jgi:hypothetical protein
MDSDSNTFGDATDLSAPTEARTMSSSTDAVTHDTFLTRRIHENLAKYQTEDLCICGQKVGCSSDKKKKKPNKNNELFVVSEVCFEPLHRRCAGFKSVDANASLAFLTKLTKMKHPRLRVWYVAELNVPAVC